MNKQMADGHGNFSLKFYHQFIILCLISWERLANLVQWNPISVITTGKKSGCINWVAVLKEFIK